MVLAMMRSVKIMAAEHTYKLLIAESKKRKAAPDANGGDEPKVKPTRKAKAKAKGKKAEE